MTAHTFPGLVRVKDPGPKGTPPLKMTRVRDAKGRLGGTEVRVPAGFHLDYVLESDPKAKRPTAPVAIVTVVKATGAAVNHAELEHTHETTDIDIKHGKRRNDKGQWEADDMTIQTRTLLGVTAKSTTHEGIVGEGADAAEAVRDMHAKIAAQEAAKKAANALPTEEQPVVTREG